MNKLILLPIVGIFFASYLSANTLKINGVVGAKAQAIVINDITKSDSVFENVLLLSIDKNSITFNYEQELNIDYLILQLNKNSLFVYQLVEKTENLFQLDIYQQSFNQFKLVKQISPELQSNLLVKLDQTYLDNIFNEQEFNNNFYHANQIVKEVSVIGSVESRKDQDFYILNLDQSVRVIINILGETTYQPVIRVFDRDFNQLDEYKLLDYINKKIDFSFDLIGANKFYYIQVADIYGDVPIETGRILPFDYQITFNKYLL